MRLPRAPVSLPLRGCRWPRSIPRLARVSPTLPHRPLWSAAKPLCDVRLLASGKGGSGCPLGAVSPDISRRRTSHNTVEAIVSIAAGVVAGSVALVGFGVDGGIEVTASVAYRFFLSTQAQRCEHDVLPPRRWLVPAALITYT
jgi:hypothetical protein